MPGAWLDFTALADAFPRCRTATCQACRRLGLLALPPAGITICQLRNEGRSVHPRSPKSTGQRHKPIGAQPTEVNSALTISSIPATALGTPTSACRSLARLPAVTDDGGARLSVLCRTGGGAGPVQRRLEQRSAKPAAPRQRAALEML
ncbi:unnamed protein product [Lampetra fluviatilis]